MFQYEIKTENPVSPLLKSISKENNFVIINFIATITIVASSINAMDLFCFIFGGNDVDGSFNLYVSVSILTVGNCRRSSISICKYIFMMLFFWRKIVVMDYFEV